MIGRLADAVSLVIIVAALGLLASQEARRRWRKKRTAQARPVEAYLGDCVPPRIDR